MRSRERSSRENRRFSFLEKVPEDFFKAGKHIAGMRSRERSSRENRRFSFLEKVPEDFFHGLLVS
jgi:hypothetical protein